MKKNNSKFPGRLISLFVLAILFSTALTLAIGIYLGKLYYAPPVETAVLPEPIVSTSPAVPTIDPTANWKIYESSDLEFQIRYSQEWLIKDTSIYSYDPGNYLGEKPIPEKIVKCDFTLGNDLSSVNVKNTEILQTENPKITQLVTEYIDHKNFGPGSSTNIRYVFEQNSKTISLICFFFDRTYEETFNQILSTFKFIERPSNLIY